MRLEQSKNKKIINLVLLVSYIAILLIGFPISISKGGIAPYIMIFIAIIGVILLIGLYSKINSFCCPECKTVFKVSFIKYFLSPNDPKGKILECPNCGYKGLVKVVYSEQS